MNKTVSIHTLGCRVNFYESCAIAEQLEKLGISLYDFKDCIIFHRMMDKNNHIFIYFPINRHLEYLSGPLC